MTERGSTQGRPLPVLPAQRYGKAQGMHSTASIYSGSKMLAQAADDTPPATLTLQRPTLLMCALVGLQTLKAMQLVHELLVHSKADQSNYYSNPQSKRGRPTRQVATFV